MTALPVRSAGYLPDSVTTLGDSDGVVDVEVVDVSPAVRAGAASDAEGAVAGRLVGSFRRTGFAVITGHGVAQELFAAMTEMSAQFFALPLEEKLRVGFPAPEVIRGYEPVPVESEVRSTNAMECFLVNRPDDPGDFAAGSAQARLWRWPNLWPERPAGLRPVWERYYREMDRLGERLLQLVARELGLPRQWFAERMDRHFSNLAANHYPPRPDLPAADDGSSVMRNRPHTDHGALTLLFRPSEPGGLEVYAGGRWCRGPFVEGSLVINVGDVLERWTGGLLRATPHRVVGAFGPMAASGRSSIVFFQQPNPDALVGPAPGLGDVGSRRYRPVRAGAHISGKELGAATLAALGILDGDGASDSLA